MNYNYLGVLIDNTGSLKAHLNHLKSKCNYIQNQTKFYVSKLEFKNKYLLWMIYIRSHFTYSFNLLST